MAEKFFTLESETYSQLMVTSHFRRGVAFRTNGQEIARFSWKEVQTKQSFTLPNGEPAQVQLVIPGIGLDGLQVVINGHDLNQTASKAQERIRNSILYLIGAALFAIVAGFVVANQFSKQQQTLSVWSFILLLLYTISSFFIYDNFVQQRFSRPINLLLLLTLSVILVATAVTLDSAGYPQAFASLLLFLVISIREFISGYHAFRYLRINKGAT